MAKILDQPRYVCALGAMRTVQSIPGAIPILHSGPGCAEKLNNNGAGNSGHFSPNIFPCTSISEKEVVFGGNDKLKATIENALKVINAELFVVLTGCTPEIVGDRVEEISREFQKQGKPVVYVNTPGFKGNNVVGHDWVLSGILDQFLDGQTAAAQKGCVNLFAGPPLYDPYWLGNLRILEQLLTRLGLKPNTIFGHGRGIGNIKKIPNAQLNILVSPWAGIQSVRLLQDKFATPYLHYPVLPIGAFETSKFLRAVAEAAGVAPDIAHNVITESEAEYYYYIERYANTFMELRIMSKRFTVVSDAQYSLAVTKFLTNDLGMFPTKQFITDDTPKKYREAIIEEFKRLNYGIEADIEFSTNGYEIHEAIAQIDFAGTPLILGSSYEKKIAARLNGLHINISYPMLEKLVMNSSIAGYSGGLKLLEDIYTAGMSKLML
ncbi:hydrogenase [Brenneria izadpanahii]|uniref:Hydrogenase n=1 Tax=Brenneria izadpanahii TaxID=2722756 RepID=A0ABX7V0K0_9GAMM|nr:nitrogenase component 1 [Brenneria izadpanahii]QTF10102.1 hydrogenase [Brenneria izadpanahii]